MGGSREAEENATFLANERIAFHDDDQRSCKVPLAIAYAKHESRVFTVCTACPFCIAFPSYISMCTCRSKNQPTYPVEASFFILFPSWLSVSTEENLHVYLYCCCCCSYVQHTYTAQTTSSSSLFLLGVYSYTVCRQHRMKDSCSCSCSCVCIC